MDVEQFKSVSHFSTYRYGKVMEPSYVGEAIVDGVLRDKRHIYIPSWGFIIDMLKWFVFFLVLTLSPTLLPWSNIS